MLKTLSNLLKQDKEKYRVPRRVQDVIPIKRIWNDGIFLGCDPHQAHLERRYFFGGQQVHQKLLFH